MIKITNDGIEVERLNAIFERMGNAFKEIYGGNINIDPDSPDGQLLGIFSQELADVGQGFLYLRQQTDPQFATGQWLDQLAVFNGVFRRQAAHSYSRSVIITGRPFSKVDNILKVSDSTGTMWQLENDVVLDENGSGRGDLRSVDFGPFPLKRGSSLNIETVILGLEKIVTSNDAEIGEQIESDESLRLRCQQAKESAAHSSIAAITSNLFKVEEVKKVLVLENFTSEVDENEVKPHTIDCIVDGGLDNEIAQVIYKYKDGGCGLQGNTSAVIIADNAERTIKFDRPQPVDVHIKMILKRYGFGVEIEKAGIKEELTKLDFGINESVYISRLISTINKYDGFSIQQIEIGRSQDSTVAEDLEIGPREVARFLESDIEITEI